MENSVKLRTRIRNAWNVFLNKSEKNELGSNLGTSWFGRRPDRRRFSYITERTTTAAIFTRIGIDVAAIKIVHAKTNADGKYSETIKSGLNNCLTASANVDQTGRALIQDIVMSLCEEGAVAVVPVDVMYESNNQKNILTLRAGKIKEWFPKHVRVELYNDRTGLREEIILEKESIAIIENPFYAVMNEPNSTLRRLSHKLSLLDIVDNQNSSGKLDLIIQLPYVIKNKTRQDQAEERRRAIEEQLVGSKYGIAYTDGTERITQLNRPVENNLLEQIEMLTAKLYNELGLSAEILNGTADEKQMLNYTNRTLEPMMSAIKDEFNRKFLSAEDRNQGHGILTFNEPFKLVPLQNLAEIADKFTRNEILSSNEIRSIIGFMPSSDPTADELRNSNLNRSKEDVPAKATSLATNNEEKNKNEGDNQNGI